MSVPYISPEKLAEATGDHEAIGGIMPLVRQIEDKLDIEEKIERFTPIQTLPTPLNRHRWPPEMWERMQRIANGEEE